MVLVPPCLVPPDTNRGNPDSSALKVLGLFEGVSKGKPTWMMHIQTHFRSGGFKGGHSWAFDSTDVGEEAVGAPGDLPGPEAERRGARGLGAAGWAAGRGPARKGEVPFSGDLGGKMCRMRCRPWLTAWYVGNYLRGKSEDSGVRREESPEKWLLELSRLRWQLTTAPLYKTKTRGVQQGPCIDVSRAHAMTLEHVTSKGYLPFARNTRNPKKQYDSGTVTLALRVFFSTPAEQLLPARKISPS